MPPRTTTVVRGPQRSGEPEIQKRLKSLDFRFRRNDARRVSIPRSKLGNHDVVH
jgi:hypothetical protein